MNRNFQIENKNSFSNYTSKNFNNYNQGNHYNNDQHYSYDNGSKFKQNYSNNQQFYSNDGKYFSSNKTYYNGKDYNNRFNGNEYNGNKNFSDGKFPKQEDNISEWGYRYSRNGSIRRQVLQEDEELFREHIESLKKKESFDFSLLESMKLKIYFNAKEIEPQDLQTKFSEINIHNSVLSNIEKMGFEMMTPIQKYVIPFVQKGYDVMGCSQTGSGKTISFLAPMVNKMLNEGPPKEFDCNLPNGMSAPVTLILAPTRELADQIYREARKIIHRTGMNVVKVYGGVPMDSQVRELKFGCDILVATPGRLIDFLDRRLLTLAAVKHLIIDEADRMLDMGFEDQLKDIMFSRDMPEKEKRINLMFSATFPTEVKKIANKFMNNYYFITSNPDWEKSSTANANVEQNLMYVEENQKIFKLHEILQQIKGNVIIFLETKRGVDNLDRFLNSRNYNVIAMHGDKVQNKRQEAINKFSNGEVPILVATDVASRGLDFPHVSYVFNYDMPTNIDDYIHRIGRTGRCGNKGTAVSFINEKNKPIIKDLHSVLVKMNQKIPDWFETIYQKNLNDYSTNNSTKKYGNYSNNGSGWNSNKGERRDEHNPLTKFTASNNYVNSNPKIFSNLTSDGKFPRGNYYNCG